MKTEQTGGEAPQSPRKLATTRKQPTRAAKSQTADKKEPVKPKANTGAKVKKTTSKKTAVKKSPAKKTVGKKPAAEKPAVKKTVVKQPAAKTAGVVKKSPTKKSPTKTSPVKASPTKKSPVKTSPGNKSPKKESTMKVEPPTTGRVPGNHWDQYRCGYEASDRAPSVGLDAIEECH
jgi:hypothetical protein